MAHGQVERTARVDSFEAVKRGGCRVLAGLSCELFTVGKREVVELAGRWVLELERVPCGFGGSRAFWVCPRCGRRARYLYFKDRGFLSRECAKLNYRRQQRPRDYVRDGLKLAREKLHWDPPAWVTPLDFLSLTPPCPPRMRQSTYQRHLARFRRYQEKYQQAYQKRIMALLQRIKKAAQR